MLAMVALARRACPQWVQARHGSRQTFMHLPLPSVQSCCEQEAGGLVSLGELADERADWAAAVSLTVLLSGHERVEPYRNTRQRQARRRIPLRLVVIRDRQLGADAVQDAFTEIWRNAHT